ncbi:MAG: pre-peptidase C-terminal domain-containing protein [Rubrivivax sp.]|nr:pre-peptidase C-terminal domain-containing protein [Rubrivivax sp.]
MAKVPRPHVCFDRILPRELFRPQATTGMRGGRERAISPIGKTWMNGSTLRVRFMGGSAAERANAQAQAAWWEAVANLKFVWDNSPQAEIRIAFDTGDGAWSYVGTDAKGIPFDQPTMNLGFEDGGTAAHEFGHAIGLAHEHQNPNGGIQWNEAVVIREMAKGPNFWDEPTTRHNILKRYSAEQINGTAFDPDSIMLYFFPAEWTLNGIATKANSTLSTVDKAFVAGAKMYPRNRPTVAQATPLTVNARQRTAASIGKFGEEDLFTFKAEVAGNYVIDTQGPTDVVMKLFGPNSETQLIAEDDDSGLGSNARIAQPLVPGTYWVQVRHYNRASGQGDYSIKVRRAR